MPIPFTSNTAHGLAGLLLSTGLLAAADSARPNRFSLGPRFALNLTANFANLGGVPAQTDPRLGIYDDGHHLVDISGNAGDSTWNWGYDRADQYLDDAIRMSSLSSPGTLTAPDASGDPQFGLELTYARELGRWGTVRWGWEAAFGYTAVSIHDRRTLAGDVVRMTDAFPLEGVIPPLAPYRGSFEGPGPLLGTVPVRQTIIEAGAVPVAGKRDLEADLYGWRFGPYIEVPVIAPVTLQVGAGLALAWLNSRFAYSETVTLPGVGRFTGAGSSSSQDWLLGGYAEARINVALNPCWSVFAAAQYQHLGRFTQQTDGKQARLDLGGAVFVATGLSLSF